MKRNSKNIHRPKITKLPLSKNEQGKDMSQERLTPAIFLLPGEELVSVAQIRLTVSDFHPDHRKTLRHLATKDGTIHASSVSRENSHHKELRMYETVFGRDSIISSQFLLEIEPDLARSTIRALAARQGSRDDWRSEEEPGKIFHEDRSLDDEIGQELREKSGWEFPYFGSVDATPRFVNLILSYCEKHGWGLLEEEIDHKALGKRKIKDSLFDAVAWVMKKQDENPEGIIEARRKNPGGLLNQAWKDSFDSYFFSDGEFPDTDSFLSSVEVQALAYDAFLGMAQLLENENGVFAGELIERAGKLRKSVMDLFFLEDEKGGYFALGSERTARGELRIFDIRTSNMGHLLNSRILDGDDPEIVKKREAVIKTLFSEEMLGYWGIRTLSSREKRFREGAYHNGSVWFWDNYYIALGLERHGFDRLAQLLKGKIVEVVKKWRRYPEFAKGGNEPEDAVNRRLIIVRDTRRGLEYPIEQPPQEIQGWTLAAFYGTLNSWRKPRQPYPALEDHILERLGR